MNLNVVKKNIALISTRPSKKNIDLLKGLENTNISLLSHPLTEIIPLTNYDRFDEILNNLKNYQHIIFISTNAVQFFISRANKLSIKLPKHIIFSSIGPATQKALKDNFDINVHYPKKNFDSKYLLKNKVFKHIQNKKVLVVRGIGGRESLKKMLEKKGADVDYGECYIRNYLPINFEKIQQEIKAYNSIFLLITSHESAIHFLAQNKGDDWQWLKTTKVIVNHPRIKEVLDLTCDNIILTNDIALNSLLKIVKSN
tara:strand:+ start:1653 stop:2420 length:768 start_codon:yes stop_codon:yes gene_type:complete